jgi:AraC-like DNA-binding protein
MNDVYFSNLFKKTFNISPQKYVLQRKLDRARLLLINFDKPIADISDELKFTDTAAFSNFFKKQTGITPKAFRNKILQ